MKKSVKAILSVSLALILALSSLPFAFTANAAEPEPAWTVPEGYNAHDYTKCVEFLEQTDEEGVKNGEIASGHSDGDGNWFLGDYDPNDPLTWGTRFSWISINGEQRIESIQISDMDTANERYLLEGNLDLSGCTALTFLGCRYNRIRGLDVSGCTSLAKIDCSINRITELNVSDCSSIIELVCSGNSISELNLSHCTALTKLAVAYNAISELNVSDCIELTELYCSSGRLASLDVSGCTALTRLSCFENNLTELDVSTNTELDYLNCRENLLTYIDLSSNTALMNLDCRNNRFTELDLSNNPLRCTQISAEGNGYVGYYGQTPAYLNGFQHITAKPHSGATFEGFYDENGALISDGSYSSDGGYYYYARQGASWSISVIARFSGGSAVIPGDVDSSGDLTISDAIITLRLCLQLVDGSDFNSDAADMDGSGAITITDAISILRIALGI